ncbi:hypothetical protein O6P43_007052 [Quillaja saponaria]|uniref:Uncharacterized protein n=1 Tax=Quillaja saponaria TaxID=32244 RepID=A0AAD7VIY1_QUISA|nr:hypothetical protein O6P43_007052 [Quillaja saponaria]
MANRDQPVNGKCSKQPLLKGVILWLSFDFPSYTLLPLLKLVSNCDDVSIREREFGYPFLCMVPNDGNSCKLVDN